MPSKKTVAEIVGEMRNDAIAADAWCETHGEMASAASVLRKHADRIEAAHNRDVDSYKRLLRTSQAALEVELVKNKELRASLERAINIICGKCYDKVRAKCARGEKKDCEVFALRKAFAEGEKK